HNFSKWIAKIRLGNFNLIFDLVEALEKFIEDPILAQIYIFQETLCKSTSIIKERGRLFRQPLTKYENVQLSYFYFQFKK
ncbi:hypothetical protein ACQKCJ_20185, partial [Flavobacterium sp. NPDC079362]|uniref:hypothetical protein n=1 Tax=Flavobacterium sp. NPDC079362 TaxID=3390566 RepID=UPI003D002BB1